MTAGYRPPGRLAGTLAALLTMALLTIPTLAGTLNRKLVGRPAFHSYATSQICPDSKHLVFTAVEEEGGEEGLYSKPLLGGSTIRLDNPPGADETMQAYAITTDAQWVLYVAESADGETAGLYKVPIDGPATARVGLYTWASPPLSAAGAFKISPDGNWVVIRADPEQDDDLELFRVSIDGGAPTRISGTMVSGGDVNDYRVSPDSTWVVYRADQDANGHSELYSVPLLGTFAQVAHLNHDIRRWLIVCEPSGDTGRDAIDSFEISPNSERVVYRAETIVNDGGACDEVHELFSTPIDGSADAVQIQDATDAGGYDAETYLIGPNGARVVYVYDEERRVHLTTYHVHELYSVPILGPPGAAAKLHPDLANDRDVEDNFKVSSDTGDSRVVYVADQDTNGVSEIYSVPIAGGTPAKLNPSLLPGASLDYWNYEVTPDGHHVVFVVDMGRTYPDFALFSVPIEGPGSAAMEISGPMVAGGSLYAFPPTRFKISPDSQRVAYRADQDVDEVYELYSVPVAGPPGTSTRLSGPMPTDGDIETDPSYRFSPDGQWITYVADQETDGVWELFVAGEGEYQIHLPLILRGI